ncbi:hypothetical protein B0H11DRAFT_1898700 [Mycena galericulata]|nr:hypothetical protein B0H11DRAFT_1898700 [Mycena galericulata]
MQDRRYMNLGQLTPTSVSPWLRTLIWADLDEGHQEPTLAEMNSPSTSEDHNRPEARSTSPLIITGLVYSAELFNDMSGARIYHLVAPEGRLELFKSQMETFYRVIRALEIPQHASFTSKIRFVHPKALIASLKEMR